MKRSEQARIPVWVLVAGCLCLAEGAWAQDTDEAAEDAPSASQETDVNEDNYRRFMELRDQEIQRPSQPYAVLAPPGNLEKMDKLPEESQKHLRNQLRGIILESDRWTPAEAGKTYPFVASAAGERDPRLQKMEAEAWGELVENYHAREAEIQQAGARARSATADPDAGRMKLRDTPGEAGSSSRSESPQRGAAGTGGADGAHESAPREAGVTQSALEYLTGAQGHAGPAGSPVSAARQGESGRDNADDTAQGGTDAATTEAADPGDSQALQAQAASGNEASDAANDAVTETSESPATEQVQRLEINASEASETADAQQADRERTEVDYRSEGVIAIRDLDKLQGMTPSPEPEAEEETSDEG